jgi:hypothetical protein
MKGANETVPLLFYPIGLKVDRTGAAVIAGE